MTSKATTDKSLTATTQAPLRISPSDKLLASRISLPKDALIVYSLFKPSPNSVLGHESIEGARRQVLSLNGSALLLESLLTSIYIGKESFMYVFMISSATQLCDAESTLKALSFDKLAVSESSSFSAQDICSNTTVNHLSPPQAILFSYFLEAVRLRVIDDIVQVPTQRPQISFPKRRLKRFKDGFLMSPSPAGTAWDSCWEYKTVIRALIFCHLHVEVGSSPKNGATYLNIHPILRPTPFLDLSSSLPLPAGSPIFLLPYGTPAYFLSVYAGPAAGLVKQFRESLQGTGVGEWDFLLPRYTSSFSNRPTFNDGNGSFTQGPVFIVGWIKVENKQGEDKGMTVIYPASLCVCFEPPSLPRPHLDYIPELPVQLQPSPQVAPVIPAASLNSSNRSELDPISSVLTQAHTSDLPFLPRPSILSSPSSHSLRSFRSLTLSKSKDIRRVAVEVGAYVDAIAREREKERERLKREREGGTSSSPKLSRTTTTTPASAPTPVAVDTPMINTSVILSSSHVPVSLAGSSQQFSMQNFYPSPPQSNPGITPANEAKTSPSVEATLLPATDLAAPISLPDVSPSVEPIAVSMPSSVSSATTSYNPFDNIDPSWSQSSQSYMDMDMDFGMDIGFGMNMNSMTNSGSGGGVYHGNRNEMDFEDAFTDDDFNFFDRPSRATIVPPLEHIQPSDFLQSAAPLGISPPMFNDVNASGQSQETPNSHPIISWTPGVLMEGFTPRSTDHQDTHPCDLAPLTPRLTPDSQSVPNTPNIYLDTRPLIARKKSAALHDFEPIPFASYHRLADGKYASGKFALPSPPADVDRTEPLTSFSCPVSPRGWMEQYNAVTDPRVSLVKKLIGVKRKIPFRQGGRHDSKLSPWIRRQEDWGGQMDDDRHNDDEDLKSDQSDDDDFDDSESPSLSRPITPPPAYLPLGPSLLHTQFQHAQLLPLSIPLRPPGAAVAPTNIAAVAPLPSVPTPVSPAAAMGAASEKSKSLEAAASMIAVEVVENKLWAETWRANTPGSKQVLDIWMADVKMIAQLFEATPTLEGPLNVTALFGLDPSESQNKLMQSLDTPMVSIGKGDAVIQVLPTALRFWDKLGLGPKAGPKNASVFVLFEDDDQRQVQVDSWIAGTISAYESKHFGKLQRGTSTSCSRDGLVPVHFDPSFRKSLTTLTGSLSLYDGSIIVFVVFPIVTMNLTSPILRQILSTLKKALKTFPAGQLLFQFVPEQCVMEPIQQSVLYNSQSEILCSSIYNRMFLPVERLMSRTFSQTKESTRSYFKDAAFTLARPVHHKVSFVRASHVHLDVMDRHTFLHVGYSLSPCGKWILAACVDQRGEAHELGVWLTQSPGEDGEPEFPKETYIIKKVWNFAIAFSKKANLEWKLVIARVGHMSIGELNAWKTHLSSAILQNKEFGQGHVTLLSVEPNAPWLFITTQGNPPSVPRSSSSNRSSSLKHHTVFTDVSSTTYTLFPSIQTPVCLSPPRDLGIALSYIAERPSSPSSELPSSSPSNTSPLFISETSDPIEAPSLPHPLSYLPRSTAIVIRVPSLPSPTSISMLQTYILHTIQSPLCPSAPPLDSTLHTDIVRNYYDLAVLSRERWKLDSNAILPFHLAAVETMNLALDRDWDRMEAVVDL